MPKARGVSSPSLETLILEGLFYIINLESWDSGHVALKETSLLFGIPMMLVGAMWLFECMLIDMHRRLDHPKLHHRLR